MQASHGFHVRLTYHELQSSASNISGGVHATPSVKNSTLEFGMASAFAD
jgi:hypothetical protein